MRKTKDTDAATLMHNVKALLTPCFVIVISSGMLKGPRFICPSNLWSTNIGSPSTIRLRVAGTDINAVSINAGSSLFMKELRGIFDAAAKKILRDKNNKIPS
jgi:hypothetical protein